MTAYENIEFPRKSRLVGKDARHARLREVTGKDGNALNEVELLTESLMNNRGVLRCNSVIKFVPEASVLKLNVGDRIQVNTSDFERVAKSQTLEPFLGVSPSIAPPRSSSQSRWFIPSSGFMSFCICSRRDTDRPRAVVGGCPLGHFSDQQSGRVRSRTEHSAILLDPRPEGTL